MNDVIAAALNATARKVAPRATVGEGPDRQILPFDAKNRCFSGEASQYGRFVETGWATGRRTARIELTSTATGNVAVFVRTRDERDAEGELLCTVFAPTAQTLQNNPGLRGVTVRLFND